MRALKAFLLRMLGGIANEANFTRQWIFYIDPAQPIGVVFSNEPNGRMSMAIYQQSTEFPLFAKFVVSRDQIEWIRAAMETMQDTPMPVISSGEDVL